MNHNTNIPGAGTGDSRFRALEERLRTLAPRRIRCLPLPAQPEIRPGQVWETLAEPVLPRGIAESCRTEEPFQVLVLSVLPEPVGGRQIIEVAPIAYESEMAGPDDCILPRDVLGYDAAVLFSASVNMLADNLLECRGQIPEHLAAPLIEFADSLQSGDPDAALPENIQRGRDYFYEGDLRWNWHQALPEKLDYLQTPAIVWLEECGGLEWNTTAETASEPDNIIPFPVEIETKRPVALAAASGSAERPLEFHVLKLENTKIRVHLAELEAHPGAFSIIVENDESGLLENARILDASGQPIGTVRNNQAGSSDAPLHLEEKGIIKFSIVLADGSSVKLVPMSDAEE